MHIKTILNHVTQYKSFVFQRAYFLESESPQLAVEIEPRANGRPICSSCGKPGPGYDRAAEPRWFEFVPLWGITVYFAYRMRRVKCRRCGVKVERVPWAEGKSTLTTEYKWFLARWARPVFELYDLKADPHELNNLAGSPDYKEVETRMRQELDKWMVREHDYLPLPSHATWKW